MNFESLSDRLQNFEQAFTTHGGGCLRECACGKKFYSTDTGYDWEEGEREALEADPKAEGHDYTISTLWFEGREYCVDCTCWNERANKIMQWIDDHGHAVAEWLSLEKKRLQKIAEDAPTVS